MALEFATPSRRSAALASDLRTLIRQMRAANPLWGAPRIHGELQTLGVDVRREAAALELVARLCPDIGQTQGRDILTNDQQARRKHQASSGERTVSFISNQ